MQFNTHPNAPIKTGETNNFTLLAGVSQEIVSKSDASRKRISIVNNSDNGIQLNFFGTATAILFTVFLPKRTNANEPAGLYESPSPQAFIGKIEAVSAVGMGAGEEVIVTEYKS